jgi:hypothetical protein
MSPGRYGQRSSWIYEFNNTEKYVGSFEFVVEYEGRNLMAKIRKQPDNVYLVSYNGTFVGYLHKEGEEWLN